MRLSYKNWATSFSWKLYNKSYFEAGRCPRKRSLQSVNEHFEDKPDAERALLYGFYNHSYISFQVSRAEIVDI